jgi:hypothetical protein
MQCSAIVPKMRREEKKTTCFVQPIKRLGGDCMNFGILALESEFGFQNSRGNFARGGGTPSSASSSHQHMQY